MHRLLYISDLDPAQLSCEPEKEVETIAEKSARANAHMDLSGVLLYVNSTFIQVIEGPRDRIETTFENICCDIRHKNIRVIEFEPVKSRLFANWAMGFVGASLDPVQIKTNVLLQEIALSADARPAEALWQIRQLLDTESDRTARSPDAGVRMERAEKARSVPL